MSSFISLSVSKHFNPAFELTLWVEDISLGTQNVADAKTESEIKRQLSGAYFHGVGFIFRVKFWRSSCFAQYFL